MGGWCWLVRAGGRGRGGRGRGGWAAESAAGGGSSARCMGEGSGRPRLRGGGPPRPPRSAALPTSQPPQTTTLPPLGAPPSRTRSCRCCDASCAGRFTAMCLCMWGGWAGSRARIWEAGRVCEGVARRLRCAACIGPMHAHPWACRPPPRCRAGTPAPALPAAHPRRATSAALSRTIWRTRCWVCEKLRRAAARGCGQAAGQGRSGGVCGGRQV